MAVFLAATHGSSDLVLQCKSEFWALRVSVSVATIGLPDGVFVGQE